MMRVVSLTMLPIALATAMLAMTDAAVGQTAYPPETPLFTRHVVPLFSRLGCNAGTCHGKVKGENGFRLSLFGVDAKADHASLLKEYGGRRVNLADVDASVLLLKPLGEISHGGGKAHRTRQPRTRNHAPLARRRARRLIRWMSRECNSSPSRRRSRR